MPFQRALFIRFGGLGDILLTTPAVRAVAQAFPGIAIDYIVATGMTEALDGNPYLRQVIPFDKGGQDAHPRRFLPFLIRLAQTRYDLVVNFNPSVKSYLMSFAACPRKLVTFRKRMQVQGDTGRVAHAIDDFTKELRGLGILVPADRSMDFVVPDDARRSISRRLAAEGVCPNDRLLVICPSASRPINRWPLDRLAAVAAYFASLPDVRVAVTAAPWETERVQPVIASDRRILDFAGEWSVKELGALLMRADTLLTCDTGPMHIGAALGTPLVVLSGAADPDRTGPLREDATVLINRSLPCVPCRRKTCAYGDIRCMQGLSTDAVITAVRQRLLISRAASDRQLVVL